VVIEGAGLPGPGWPPGAAGKHRNLHIALCTKSKERPALVVPGKPWLAAEPVPGDAPSARWEVPVTVRRETGGFDFSGPYVRGDHADRHLFLAWGDVPGDGTLQLIRGSKLKLSAVDPRIIEEAMRPGYGLVARIRLTGTRGSPRSPGRRNRLAQEPASSQQGQTEKRTDCRARIGRGMRCGTRPRFGPLPGMTAGTGRVPGSGLRLAGLATALAAPSAPSRLRWHQAAGTCPGPPPVPGGGR
jgi:hypothetical protein